MGTSGEAANWSVSWGRSRGTEDELELRSVQAGSATMTVEMAPLAVADRLVARAGSGTMMEWWRRAGEAGGSAISGCSVQERPSEGVAGRSAVGNGVTPVLGKFVRVSFVTSSATSGGRGSLGLESCVSHEGTSSAVEISDYLPVSTGVLFSPASSPKNTACVSL